MTLEEIQNEKSTTHLLCLIHENKQDEIIKVELKFEIPSLFVLHIIKRE